MGATSKGPGAVDGSETHRIPAVLGGPKKDLGGSGLWNGFGEAWAALSTLLAGIGVVGGIGFGLDHLLGTKPVLVAVGVIAGNFAGIYLIYVKYFREVPPSAP